MLLVTVPPTAPAAPERPLMVVSIPLRSNVPAVVAPPLTTTFPNPAPVGMEPGTPWISDPALTVVSPV